MMEMVMKLDAAGLAMMVMTTHAARLPLTTKNATGIPTPRSASAFQFPNAHAKDVVTSTVVMN